MTLAVIPAKGESRRIPNKNARPFHGHPIIAYSIAAARYSRLFDQIVVSTDSPAIAQIAHKYGADAIWRPAGLCLQEIGTQAVARHAAMMIAKPHDLVCCIYATAPTMALADMQKGRNALVDNFFYQFAVGVGIEPLQDAGQFYWSRREALMNEKMLHHHPTALIPIRGERICDINTEDDWQRALGLYEKYTEIKDPSI